MSRLLNNSRAEVKSQRVRTVDNAGIFAGHGVLLHAAQVMSVENGHCSPVLTAARPHAEGGRCTVEL